MGFILGSIAGSLYIFLISKSGLIGILVDQIDQTQVFIRLIFPLLIMIIVIFLGDAIHGAVLGLRLSAIDPLTIKGGYIYCAAIAKGITQGILNSLFILVTATMRFTQPIIGLRQPSNRDRQRGFFPFSLVGRIRRGSSPAS